MGNPEFDDVSVLATLQKLLKRDVLAEDDKQALLRQLKSQWGRDAADQILDNRRTLDDDKLRTLRRFSTAFR